MQDFKALYSRLCRTWYGIGKCGKTHDGVIIQIQKNVGTNQFRIDFKTQLPIIMDYSIDQAVQKFNELANENDKFYNTQSESKLASRQAISPIATAMEIDLIIFYLTRLVALYRELNNLISQNGCDIIKSIEYLGNVSDLYDAFHSYEIAYDALTLLEEKTQAKTITIILETLAIDTNKTNTITAAYKFVSGAILIYESQKNQI